MKFIDEFLHSNFIHVLGNQIQQEEISNFLEVVETLLIEDIIYFVSAHFTSACLKQNDIDTSFYQKL